MNKKGAAPIAIVLAAFIGIIFLTFFAGGGIGTVFDISKTIGAIPPFVWMILGIIIVFRLLGGRRR